MSINHCSQTRAQRARQVADALRQQITAGRFADGFLPDERALISEFSASRNAVRMALRALCDEGLIIRRQGVGTRVVGPKLGHGLDRLQGLAEMVAGAGTISNQVVVAEFVTDLPEAIADRLRVRPESGGVHLERIRWLDGTPLSLDSTYLTAEVGRHVVAGDMSGRDVFGLIEEQGSWVLGHAEVTVHAVNADADTARLLRIRDGAAIFAIERLSCLRDGTPVDVESIRVRADRMALHATVYRGSGTSPQAGSW